MKSLICLKTLIKLSPIMIGIVAFLMPLPSMGTSQPVFRPNLKISKSNGSINIDGKLDDLGWKAAARTDNFIERGPGDNTVPAVATEVCVTYDDSKIYIAYVCHDDPKTIRATMSQRDQWFGNDAVIVLIDTYGTGTWAYEFFVNPYGIQKDGLWSSLGDEDQGYDLIWESAAQRTDSGYQVEIAIPFAGLRFPNKEMQTWRMDFWRNRPRESAYQYSWAAYDRNEQCWPCQWGTMEGIQNVHSGKGIEFLPSFVASQSGELHGLPSKDVEFKNADARGELSLGGKYSISSDVTIEAAYNPDFSQIEADAAQIAVNSTIALMYPERRPYFQEGSDIFRTMFNSFYTRSVNNPQYTAKLTGRVRGNALGFLIARDENSPYIVPLNQSSLPPIDVGKSTVNVLRGSRAFGGSSRVGFMLTDRRFENDGVGSILSLDGRLRLSKNYAFDYQFIGSYTKELNNPALTADYVADFAAQNIDTTFDNGQHTIALDGESYYGEALITRFCRNARSWNFMIDYNQISPAYRTTTGYDPVINNRTLNPSTSYTFYFNRGILQQLRWGISKFNRWDFDGHVENNGTFVDLDGQLNFAQAAFDIGYNRATRYYQLQRFDGLFDASAEITAIIGKNIGMDIYFGRGRDIFYDAMGKGNYTNINAALNLKPFGRITIEPNFNFSRMTNIENGGRYYNGYISRTRVQFQATKELSLRLVVQYDDFYRAWNIDPLMTFRLNSFSVFYLGSDYAIGDIAPIQRWGLHQRDIPTTWKMTSRQFFMKLQYLFQT
ncbi:MAG: carbohydrate binding family 9 domain-containing protein [candidate division Zixibacteria bacterium]|nr:carbohydrate binding family 9 domain-containing protein [candidate division Zixibacteria bacterium]